MKSRQAGFTLVEIAIVLVIIGLLLGGVLKGQELINSAKVKNFATDFRNIPLFIYGYQDKFKALPGDDSAVATTHLGTAVGGVNVILATTPGTPAARGNGVIEGDERRQMFQGMRPDGATPDAGGGNGQQGGGRGGRGGQQQIAEWAGEGVAIHGGQLARATGVSAGSGWNASSRCQRCMAA